MAEKENRIPDEVVDYSLFPAITGTKYGEDLKKVLEEYVRSYLTLLSPHLIDVIWQNEGFNLTPAPDKESYPPHLHGSTKFGDNVEDEWFIVYLLFELTRQCNGLVAKVCDIDEEFLLIEAADTLPKWLNPESAENRVYIYQGRLHVIPIPQSPKEVALFPRTITSIVDAVECIRAYPNETRSAPKIQAALQKRIKSFPGIMRENIHYTHCYVPAVLGTILDKKPQLVAAAVRAFYYRDPIDLKCCRTFKHFRPGTRVMHRTRFTRCLYAQMLHQNFQPDRRSGWVMPSSSNAKHRAYDLGMKLAHGFEILCSKSTESPAGETTSNSIPTNNIKWQKYVRSLKEKNYFRGEIEGSVLYQELLDLAWRFYRDNLVNTNSSYSEPGNEILHLLNTVEYNIEKMRMAEHSLLPPDDDSWLTLTPASLDNLLKNKSCQSNSNHDNDVFDLNKVADSMKKFVGNVSDIEGAEFPSADGDEDDGEIHFDGTSFISGMQEMFNFADKDNDNDSDSSSGIDEYGWDDNIDAELNAGPGNTTKPKPPPSLDKYMHAMDRELARSDVGKSFEKHQKPAVKNTAKPALQKKPPKVRDINDEDDDFQPVDIDFNAVKNILESYSAQEGLPGPSSNILGSMGVTIPPNADAVRPSASGRNTSKPSTGSGDAARSSSTKKSRTKSDSKETVV